MGNNLSCSEFYCQSIDSKPEWFSENNYLFFFKNNIISNQPFSSFIKNNSSENNSNLVKPYKIDKGKIYLIFNNDFELIITKKLDIDLSIPQFSIPFNFSLNFPLNLSLFFVFTDFLVDFNNIHYIKNLIYNNQDSQQSNISNQSEQLEKLSKENIFFIQISFSHFNLSIDIPQLSKKYFGKIKNKKNYFLSLTYQKIMNHSILSESFKLNFESNNKSILNSSFDVYLNFKQTYLSFFISSNNSHNNQFSSFSFFLD